jgi:hypothetical protein
VRQACPRQRGIKTARLGGTARPPEATGPVAKDPVYGVDRLLLELRK